MRPYDLLQVLIFTALVVLVTKPLGGYMARVFNRERTLLDPILRPIESMIYRICRIDPESEMRWTTYTATMLILNFVGIAALYVILRVQKVHPFNPQHFAGFSPDLAFNTAVSFATNTNWQAYAGESAASYFTQMAGLTVQNFLSAATGIALAIALFRGLTRRTAHEIGNFWVDLTRSLLWVLLPLSVVCALILVSQGVIQNLSTYTTANTLEGGRQIIAQGPVASQEAIKMIGTNGGGFFNANSAHPFENPTPLTNLIEMLAIFAIPAGLTYTFGQFARNQKQGWALFAAMMILFLLGLSAVYLSEISGNPNLTHLGVNQMASDGQSGGNMEGKEVRFGIANSAIFATVTTDASCGAVNAMHSSFTPLAGGMVMLNIALGEIVFGGVGAGILGIVIFAILAVFIAGLMVGRTPEYLGKKIEPKEIKMAMLAVLVVAASMLCFSALAVSIKPGLVGRLSAGPHGLSEIIYAFTSASGNNGSAFAGLNANSPFYNLALALAMLIGRFLYIIPVMAIAGSMAAKKTVPGSSGTFPTTGGLFVGLLVGVILVVGALTFFPAYALGPIVEHLLMQAGKLF
ncbi:MAG TPA: potassium-transporting ATPase subunit KdpA [Armatimonadota bacterium]|jgi:K+-transporting ATPase ATPase A chain